MNKNLQTKLKPLVYVPILSTLVVSPSLNFDPINVPKFSVAVALTFYLCISTLTILIQSVVDTFKSKELPAVTFVTGIMFSLIFSLVILARDGETLTSSLYGTYGRLFGALTYACLLMVALLAFFGSSHIEKQKLLWGVVITNLLVCAYITLQYLEKDFISWMNIYPGYSSFLGNPNFAAAFIGISAVVATSFLFWQGHKLSAATLFTFSVFANLQTKSEQGLVLQGFGLFVSSIFLLRLNTQSKSLVRFIYSVGSLAIALVFMGSFIGRGPFQFLYSYTIELRKIYWSAAISIFWSSPFLGHGFDVFGEEYRAVMSPENPYTNSPHNYTLDLAVSGGVFLLVPWLIVSILPIAIGARKLFLLEKNLDFFQDFIIWLAYLLFFIQTLINPFNLSLAFWLFFFMGHSASFMLKKDNAKSRHKKIDQGSLTRNRSNRKVLSGSQEKDFGRQAALRLLGILVALGATIPLMRIDLLAREAFSSAELGKIRELGDSNFYQYAQLSANVLQENGRTSEALEIVRRIVQSNPDNAQGWHFLTLHSDSKLERNEALRRLKHLDPTSELKRPLP